jgi:excisionase family DNA binding protein
MVHGDRLAVSVREAAAMLSISPRTLQNFIAVKRIPARKAGRRTLILVRDLEAFLRRDHPSPQRCVQDGREIQTIV